jgi:hypothetical protein
MKHYLASFKGRLNGAIGTFERFSNIPVDAFNYEEARLKLYETYEHITDLTLKELEY